MIQWLPIIIIVVEVFCLRSQSSDYDDGILFAPLNWGSHFPEMVFGKIWQEPPWILVHIMLSSFFLESTKMFSTFVSQATIFFSSFFQKLLVNIPMFLVGGLEHEFYVSIQLGMSSSQLTFSPSFFRGVGLNHQPDIPMFHSSIVFQRCPIFWCCRWRNFWKLDLSKGPVWRISLKLGMVDIPLMPGDFGDGLLLFEPHEVFYWLI